METRRQEREREIRKVQTRPTMKYNIVCLSPVRAATASVKQKQHVPITTRLRAWWLGVENVEVFSRYGERSSFRNWLSDWKTTLMTMSCVGVLMLNRANSRLADECMDNMELNRMRFYQRDFEPAYVAQGNTKQGRAIYDGAVGYHYKDEATGISINADNKIVAPPRAELKRMMEQNPPQITSEMLQNVKRLREAHGYAAEKN